ncbi:EpsG family protein [Aequorivita sediminis]|uniref:EpsG family protein n=1 Tax=Aequorivita sediminis TaxID=3073653 RepID=UPI0028ADD343|nr:EpsG family protein [Aequorivita sp. F6058]
MKVVGGFYFIFLLLYMGLRPISGRYFDDMGTYNRLFIQYSNGAPITSTKDIFFHTFTKFCSQIMTANAYFLTCAFLYLAPMIAVSRKWFKTYWFYGFLFLVTSFSFWAYGTNGIRNGIAGSFFLLAISRKKLFWKIVWICLAINFHKTMLLPTAAFILANFYNQPKKLIYIWLLCIPLSLVGGGFFEGFFASLGFADERLSYLTEGNVNNDNFSSTGFRWDFLLYSATAVFAGWFYIFKRNYKDKIYFWLFNTYVLSNAFWILVIRANFSNRFAYLSWFMISLVIIYPLLKQYILEKQHKKIGLILATYFGFTFFMNVVLDL